MEKINLYLKLNTKTYYVQVPNNLLIADLYNIIKIKSQTSLQNTHVFKFNGKILQDNKTLEDYDVKTESTFDVSYSQGKINSTRKPDIQGEIMFKRLLDDIALNSGLYDINIISLMSYNVEMSNKEKILLQQLQWPTLTKELMKLDEIINKPDNIINANIILADTNFTTYNKMYNQMAQLSYVELMETNYHKTTQQINTMCDIKLNLEFLNNASKYSYRISKHSIMLNEFAFKNIFNVSKSLEKIVQLNFYFVGIIFFNLGYDDPKNNIACGFDFSALSKNNLHVNLWTGDKIIG